ncbi:MAG TPA: (Fe-S)-binding protein [Thermoleophilaceae bacterium]|nr:(Fe-S)-binding protein [Thermoleophilaceae bacterium]
MGGLPPVAAEKTREVFWDFEPALEVLWYVLAVLSALVFVYGVARPVVKYGRGRREGLPRRSELPGRIRDALRILLSHVTVNRRDGYAGFAHAGIFYGFLVLFVGTVILAINTDLTEPFFGWRFFDGDFYLGYSIVLDVLGLALLLGVVMMMIRRGVIRPQKLDYARPDREGETAERRVYRVGDWTFVGILLVLVLTGYVLEGARIAMDDPGYNEFSPAGWVAAQGFEAMGAGDSALTAVRHALWWSHGLLAIAFVAAIPWTKAAHMLTSFASLVLRDPLAGKRLRAIPPERATEPAGYGALADFTSVHLLHLDACTKCGKCHEACPALATGKPLSPRDVVLELREQSNAAMREVGIGGVLGVLIRRQAPAGGLFAQPVVGDDGVHVDTVWSCMQCNACVEACPVGIEQAPIINQLRRRLVEDGELHPNLQSTLQTIHKSGNSFGERARKRGRWTEDLDFEVKDAREQPVDVLWFVGDYASFDPRSQKVTRALARLFRAADLDFGILYDGERNSGNDVRRVGEEGLFEALAEQNISTLAACEFNRLVTSDPHSLNTLRNEYPELGGEWPVLHHTSLLLELIESGRLPVAGRLSYRVTYHDPCYLGRHNGGYDAPRAILEALGCTLVEMPRNRDNSFCCGAGGGRIWIPDEPGSERPSESRIHEAVALGDLDYFVVSCPKDVTMYEDAIKTSGNAERIELRELTELIEEAAGRAEPSGAGAGTAAA